MKHLPLLVLLIAILVTACGPVSTPTPVPTVIPPTDTSTVIPPTLTPTPPPPTETSLAASETPAGSANTLTVFAAASLTGAFTELGQNFEADHPGVKVVFNFAGSQTLSTQLSQGAVADVFASANHTEMDKMVTAGLVQPAAAVDFLTNVLVVILPQNNPAGVQTLQDLARPGLKLVLGDETVPVGKYARQVLDNLSQDSSYGADFKTRVLANVVSNETDVKQVVAKVQLGEADAGIVYVSDSVAAPELATLEIPSNFNVIARYPLAVLVNAPKPDLAKGFIAYILSHVGQAVLAKWGFTPVAP